MTSLNSNILSVVFTLLGVIGHIFTIFELMQIIASVSTSGVSSIDYISIFAVAGLFVFFAFLINFSSREIEFIIVMIHSVYSVIFIILICFYVLYISQAIINNGVFERVEYGGVSITSSGIFSFVIFILLFVALNFYIGSMDGSLLILPVFIIVLFALLITYYLTIANGLDEIINRFNANEDAESIAFAAVMPAILLGYGGFLVRKMLRLRQ